MAYKIRYLKDNCNEFQNRNPTYKRQKLYTNVEKKMWKNFFSPKIRPCLCLALHLDFGMKLEGLVGLGIDEVGIFVAVG